jgi:hypothetical protein
MEHRPDTDHVPAARRRIDRVAAGLAAYGREYNGGLALPATHRLVRQELAVHLISDILYALTAQGADADDILDRAHAHFECGVSGEPMRSPAIRPDA